MTLDPVEKLVSEASPSHQRLFYIGTVLVTVLTFLWKGVWRWVAYKPDLDAQTEALKALTSRVAALEQNDPKQNTSLEVLAAQMSEVQSFQKRILSAVIALPAMLKGEPVPKILLDGQDDER